MVVTPSSLVKVDRDLPFGPVAIVSCGVATGWGSAVVRADVRPADVVVVVGAGAVGINAVQGARMAGAKHVVAVDPVESKRETAQWQRPTRTRRRWPGSRGRPRTSGSAAGGARAWQDC